MLGFDTGTTVTSAAAVLVTVVYGWDKFHSEVRRRRDERERDELHTLARAVATVLTGTDVAADIPAPSEANPSIRDALHDLSAATTATAANVALLRRALELHLADDHGAPIPEFLLAQIRRR